MVLKRWTPFAWSKMVLCGFPENYRMDFSHHYIITQDGSKEIGSHEEMSDSFFVIISFSEIFLQTAFKVYRLSVEWHLFLHQTIIPGNRWKIRTSNWEEKNTGEVPNEKDKSSYAEKRNDKVWENWKKNKHQQEVYKCNQITTRSFCLKSVLG